jgi:hypothetical protein
VDNKRYPNDLAINFYETSSRIVLTGTKGGFSIPQIWLMGIEDPANFNHENCWYFHGLGDGDGDGIDDAYTASDYPVDIFHTDQNENGNIIFITTGAQPIHTTDFEKIVWHETGKEIFPWYVENDEFYFMNYNTGLNRLEYIFTGNDDGNVYFTHFDQLVPKGVNTFTVYPTNDQSFTFTVNIPSDTIMPTVAKTYDYTVDRVNKSGRVIQTGQTITDYNMKVREITNNDGQICLLVQFNEPDGAMMLTNPYTRLRLFIGHGWFHSPQPQQGEIADLSFLWVDVPLQTGSVVIPPEAYQWAKDKLASKGLTTLEIGGMYREQYNCLGDDCVQYHNRGYISGTTFGLTQ